MPKYTWRPGAIHNNIDADTFGGVVERLQEKLGRPVKPSDIVAEAARPNSPIRTAVTWDDRRAADKYRLWEARALLGGLQLVRVRLADGTHESGKAFYSVKTEGQGRGYSSVARVMGNMDLRAQILQSAKADLERYLFKFKHIVEMARYIPQLEEIVGNIEGEIQDITSRAKRRDRKDTQKEERVDIGA